MPLLQSHSPSLSLCSPTWSEKARQCVIGVLGTNTFKYHTTLEKAYKMNVVQSHFTGTQENTEPHNMKIHSGTPSLQKVLWKSHAILSGSFVLLFPIIMNLDVTVAEENSKLACSAHFYNTQPAFLISRPLNWNKYWIAKKTSYRKCWHNHKTQHETSAQICNNTSHTNFLSFNIPIPFHQCIFHYSYQAREKVFRTDNII